MVENKWIGISICLTLIFSVGTATAFPDIKVETFGGNVTINGTIAKNGTYVSAWISGVENNSCTTEQGMNKYKIGVCNYFFAVSGKEGDLIKFKVYNTIVAEDTLTDGDITRLDLSLIDEEVNQSAQPILEYTPGNDYILVNWTANPGYDVNGIRGYEVFRSEDNVTFQSINTTNETKYLDTGLSAGTYYYKLRTFDMIGNGANSSVVNATVIPEMFTLSGYVKYECNGTGIAGANVTLENGITKSNITDGNGYYEFMTSAGEYNLTASKGDILKEGKFICFIVNSTVLDLTGDMTNVNLTVAIKGDLNGDCEIDMNDVHKVAGMVIGTEEDLRADFNGNGYVDVGDAAKLLGYVKGGVDRL